jgi:hypothetical protein
MARQVNGCVPRKTFRSGNCSGWSRRTRHVQPSHREAIRELAVGKRLPPRSDPNHEESGDARQGKVSGQRFSEGELTGAEGNIRFAAHKNEE